ncbi:MAG: type II toxin-antitoxin system VapC family toxin [Bacteroidia bacterium]|nr:type II toxin-antitoxin system VapC family toxin [Bacteroidia bacterium]
MILIDTHIFIWFVTNNNQLKPKFKQLLEDDSEIFISIISCWEIAKLVEYKRLVLTLPISEWMNIALESSNVKILPLDLPIILDATNLPDNFHKDPADQLIVATSRVLGINLLSEDEKIRNYKFVKLID